MTPVRLTVRDQQMAAWVGRWQPATAMQVACRFGLARAIAYRRLKALQTLGYLRHERRVHELPGVHVPTHAGYELTGLEQLTFSLRSPRALWGWLAALDHAVVLARAGYDCTPSPELAAHLPLRGRIPQQDGEPVFPEFFAEGADPVAVYSAVGPGGVIDGPASRLLRQLAETAPAEGSSTRMRVLAAHDVQHRARAELGNDAIEIVTLDPLQIGSPEIP